MNPMFSSKTRATPRTQGRSIFAAAALAAAALLPGTALAYADLGGLAVTSSPTEFSQYVSPSTQTSFSTWTPGPYSSPQSLGSNGYSADVSAKSGGVTAGLKVIAPGSLTTQDAGAELIYTVTSGSPTGAGGFRRLVDASGTTTSGKAVLNSFVSLFPGAPISNIGPITVDFDAVTGFDFTPYGVPASFAGVFLTSGFYDLYPTLSYVGVSLQPDPTDSPTLFAAFDTAGFGASTLFHSNSVPELDASSGNGALALLRDRRGRPAGRRA